jgi:hypothetical protein
MSFNTKGLVNEEKKLIGCVFEQPPELFKRIYYIRELSFKCVENNIFEIFIIVMILFSSLLLVKFKFDFSILNRFVFTIYFKNLNKGN